MNVVHCWSFVGLFRITVLCSLLSKMVNLFLPFLSIDRDYDPEKAKASEIAAKRKRLAQIEQRMGGETDINLSEG